MSDLNRALKIAAQHVMTPDEIRAQRISFIVGQTGLPRQDVSAWLDRHEGRRPTPPPNDGETDAEG